MLSIVHHEESEVGCDPSPSVHPPEYIEPPSPIFERVDPYTLYVFSELFPGQHGLRILAGLLRQATVKQLVLPELGLVDASDVAVVTVQSVRLLSQLVGVAYDTLEKYIVVLDRLRLFYKKRLRHQIELYFPLRHYHLPEPGVLDAIQALRPKSQKYCYRPKVRSFADQVKRRFVLLSTGDSGKPSISIAPPYQSESQQLPDLILEDIRHIVSQEVDANVASRLLRKVEGVVRYRCTRTQSRLPAPNGDSDASVCDAESRLFMVNGDSDGVQHQTGEASQCSESPFGVSKGDSDRNALDAFSHQSRLFVIDGDSDVSTSRAESRLPASQGDSDTSCISSKWPSSMPKGDSDIPSMALESCSSLQKGDSDAPSSSPSISERRLSPLKDDSFLEKGDSDTDDEENVPPNVNVLTFKKYINVNVRIVAAFCCRALDEQPTKRGIYLKLFRECELDADAIASALLYTLVHRRDGTMRKPAAVFMKLCREYHQRGIPDEAQQLVQQYGALPYTQLLATTAKASASPVVPPVPTMSSAPQGPDLVKARSTSTHSRPEPLPALSAMLSPARETLLTLRMTLQPNGGMCQQDALRLRATLAHDRRLGLCRTTLVPLKDGSYAVLVDNTITSIVRQVAFYSWQQWQECSTTLVSASDLFSSGRDHTTTPHPLRLWREQQRQRYERHTHHEGKDDES